ncbi:hypothetical protein ABZY09_23510 [Streptomyces sp. NPDC002928]|uniref:hypothetical protein n=1 Tax=Streptomyces sp. NPDC002928 TaxID=3154440 RepID=UPI0033BB9433
MIPGVRAGLAAAGAVAGIGLLSGCSPAQLPLVAVWLDGDGQPVATVRLCDGDHGSGVRLHSWAEDDTVADDNGWSAAFGARVDVTSATFPLFTPPAAWHVEAAGQQKLLPGHAYALGFTGPRHGWNPYDGYVSFTSEELNALHPGRVWADDRAMSLGEFEKLAEDSC